MKPSQKKKVKYEEWEMRLCNMFIIATIEIILDSARLDPIIIRAGFEHLCSSKLKRVLFYYTLTSPKYDMHNTKFCTD